MAAQCMICLNSLDGSCQPVDPPTPSSDEIIEPVEKDLTPSRAPTPGGMVIASLVPCRHAFHEECLQTWLERANSCPICRQDFTTVNLAREFQGRVFSSYDVQDQIQAVAEEPPPWHQDIGEELEDDPDFRLCVKCGYGDRTEYLLICDGCENCFHTFCVGLDREAPVGEYFCGSCQQQHGPANPDTDTVELPNLNTSRASIRRRMGLHSATRRREDPRNFGPYAHTWQVVFNRLNTHIPQRHHDSVPFSRYRMSSQFPPTEQQTREDFQQWERMLADEDRQGGRGRRARESRALLEQERPPGPPGWPEAPKMPELSEEECAWEELNQAERLAGEEASGKRKGKRKERNPSPQEPSAESSPLRQFKRPTYRPAQEMIPASSQSMIPTPTNLGMSPSLVISENRQSARTVDLDVIPASSQSMISTPTNLGMSPTSLGVSPSLVISEDRQSARTVDLNDLPASSQSMNPTPTNLGLSPTSLGTSPTSLGTSPTSLGTSPTNLGMSPSGPSLLQANISDVNWTSTHRAPLRLTLSSQVPEAELPSRSPGNSNAEPSLSKKLRRHLRMQDLLYQVTCPSTEPKLSHASIADSLWDRDPRISSRAQTLLKGITSPSSGPRLALRVQDTRVAIPRPQFPDLSFLNARMGSLQSDRVSTGGVNVLEWDFSKAGKEVTSTLVRAALRPFWHVEGCLSAQEYEAINRKVSRELYKLIGAMTNFGAEAHRHWEAVAAAEVKKAVDELRK
ncbi:MAG: hypothetical protein M1816_000522 [Peltula sp. TS41687]|nr:MAG: hypothetical protein M1816_000522 [Peltula sp. TS41687]